MKTLCRFLFLALLLTPSISFSGDPQRVAASGRITAVTVYQDRALTSRSASFTLKPGSYLIAFENLPNIVQDDSVQVRGRGTAVALISGLEVRRAFLPQSGEKRVQELDARIRELERQQGALEAKKAGVASQKAFIESIRVAWGERISKELAIGRPTSTELREAAGFVGSQVTRAEEQARDIETEKKRIADGIDALRRQRDEVVGSQRRESKSVEVLVEVTRQGELTLELSAVMPQAGWTPSYDVRLAADATTADLTFRAMVRQQTGEDWDNIDLTLSTARPSSGGAPPELRPWRVSIIRPRPLMKAEMAYAAPAPLMAKRSGRAMAESAAPEDAAVEEENATIETARPADEQSSIAFRIPRPLRIPSDNNQHATVVAMEKLPVAMEYLAVPKLSPHVFLTSEITNRAAYPLLPGRVSTFVGSTFTGSSQLKKVASGEKFDLFFGTDDQVTVKREELKQQGEAGIFGSNRARYRYTITLANFRKQPVTVTLRDQLPLAGNEEIRVSLEEPSPKPEQVKSDGSIVWKLPFKAGEKREISFGILVEYPKEREVIGL